ncbi:MAG TPA: hypothetical protein VGO86_17745 [Candidatus Dormibacteraeota bacterium]|jgi:hypothetical protein
MSDVDSTVAVWSLLAAPDMKQRWAVFLAALAGSALLAVGFAVWISGLTAGAPPAPQLRTVPAGTLSRAGITVAGAAQPAYCELERSAVKRWTSAGGGGCPISGPEAQAALLPVFQADVTELALARVSGPRASGLGRDRLVWLVVVNSSLLVGVGQTSPRAVVFVDGTTGEVLTTLPA